MIEWCLFPAQKRPRGQCGGSTGFLSQNRLSRPPMTANHCTQDVPHPNFSDEATSGIASSNRDVTHQDGGCGLSDRVTARKAHTPIVESRRPLACCDSYVAPVGVHRVRPATGRTAPTAGGATRFWRRLPRTALGYQVQGPVDGPCPRLQLRAAPAVNLLASSPSLTSPHPALFRFPPKTSGTVCRCFG